MENKTIESKLKQIVMGNRDVTYYEKIQSSLMHARLERLQFEHDEEISLLKKKIYGSKVEESKRKLLTELENLHLQAIEDIEGIEEKAVQSGQYNKLKLIIKEKEDVHRKNIEDLNKLFNEEADILRRKHREAVDDLYEKQNTLMKVRSEKFYQEYCDLRRSFKEDEKQLEIKRKLLLELETPRSHRY